MENTILLRAGDFSAAIDLLRGAQCVKLTHSEYNADLLRHDVTADPASFLYGMPLLFPPNRISKGVFTFEGREYRFPINDLETGSFLHGEMNRAAFSVEETRGSRYLSCVYHATKEAPYLAFPHAFTVRMEYELSENALCQTVRVTNDSEENMPYGIGFHTTFNVPFVRDSAAKNVLAYVDVSEEYERDQTYFPTGRIITDDPLTQKLSKGLLPACEGRVSRHYKRGESGEMSLTDCEKHLRVRYRPDPKFAYRLIFNGDASGYICLEPQSWMTDSPNSPFGRENTGFRFLRPGESDSYRSEIVLEKN